MPKDNIERAIKKGTGELEGFNLEDESNWEIFTPPEAFETVRNALKAKGIPIAAEELGMIPQTSVKLEGKQALQMLKLMEALEEHDDLTNVWANFDIEEKEIEAAMSK